MRNPKGQAVEKTVVPHACDLECRNDRNVNNYLELRILVNCPASWRYDSHLGYGILAISQAIGKKEGGNKKGLLSYSDSRPFGVGGTGLEPVTPSLSSWCSNQLS